MTPGRSPRHRVRHTLPALEEQLSHIAGPEDADRFNRSVIEQAFRDADFELEKSGLDPNVGLPRWLAHLEEIHGDLDIYVQLNEQYPDGVVSSELISLDELIKLDFGPDD